MQSLETKQDGAAAQLAVQALREQVAREARWGYLLEGIRAPRTRSLVAQLLDNQTRVGLYEDDTTGDIPVFTTIALAFIPKVYPALLINQIASVQPMNGPAARVFYEDFVKDSDGTSFTHGEASGIITAEAGTVQKARYKLVGATISAQKWALQVQWTTELQEDLRAQYNQDLQSRVFDYVARELVGNIDATAIGSILSGASGGNVNWSVTPGTGYTASDWNRTLYGAIVDASLNVERARFRHPDYIVCSPAFAAALEKLESFKAVGWTVGRDDETPDASVHSYIGVNVFGTVAGRWTVYRSPWISDGTSGHGQAFVGIAGEGFIYAPYVPVQLGPVLPIPNTDELARTMRTRAGMMLTLPNAFSTVTITA